MPRRWRTSNVVEWKSLTLVSITVRTIVPEIINRVLVKLQIQPTVVILSLRTDEAVEKCFDPEGRSRESVSGDSKHYVLGKKKSPTNARFS